MNRPSVRVISPTELVNLRTTRIDEMPTSEVVRMMNAEDQLVPDAVAACLPQLAALVDAAVERVSADGRVHYFGAGTSGRLALMDAAELLPTYGAAAANVVIAHHAGRGGVVECSEESAEDDDDGTDTEDVAGADVVIGVAASGRTPYVGAALRAGRAAGAVTALVTSNPQAPLSHMADYLLAADTGPDAITGSTRLKAGTAQKLILNTFSTALMVRLGHTYGNLMVDMVATNAKLRGRSIEMLVQATGDSDADCEAALDLCEDRKTAMVYLLAQGGSDPVGSPTPAACRAALVESGGRMRPALAALAEP